MVCFGQAMGSRRPPPRGATCYACAELATTWEHAPAKAFYPRRGEVRHPHGSELRDNLIVVPSCRDHNAAKSKDDSYLVSHIVVISASILASHFPEILLPGTREPFVDRHIEALHGGKRLSEAFFGDPLSISTRRGEFARVKP